MKKKNKEEEDIIQLKKKNNKEEQDIIPLIDQRRKKIKRYGFNQYWDS